MSLVSVVIVVVLALAAVGVVIVSLNAMLHASCPFCSERGSKGAPVPLIFRWWCLECGRMYNPSNPTDETETFTSSWSDEELAEVERGRAVRRSGDAGDSTQLRAPKEPPRFE